MTILNAHQRAHNTIIVGRKYNIVGRYGGCTGQKCNKCRHFPNGIRVKRKRVYINGDRTIEGESLPDLEPSCSFDPRDLVLFCPNWKKRLGVKK